MSAAPTAALRWAINALDEERYKDEAAAARCELLDLIEALGVARGVVAAQREALRECDAVIAVMTSYIDDLLDHVRVANTPSLAHRDSAGPFGLYAQARLEELVGKVSALGRRFEFDQAAECGLVEGQGEVCYEPEVRELAQIGLALVAIAGRPVARAFDDGMTIEVVRVASDGHRNACSMLYGACQRAAFALGYRRVITYTQAGESGASPKAAGFHVIGERPPRAGWSAPSRPRDNETYRSSQRQLWEVVAPGSLTSPVDTAPRGYVTASADGPVGVYHAETPDAYLKHGDK